MNQDLASHTLSCSTFTAVIGIVGAVVIGTSLDSGCSLTGKLVTLCCPSSLEAREDTDVKGLRLVCCMGWQAVQVDALSISSLAHLHCNMRPMAIDDQDYGLVGITVSCLVFLCLWNENILEPLFADDVVSPAIIGEGTTNKSGSQQVINWFGCVKDSPADLLPIFIPWC